ncbi:hypothetical protein [Clostridium sp. HBUAS56017]|uniref:hypothetical protein n=1 Tax=Clostridium sp. HBUAS56017 TaxID=2571128 RepID=UPI001A9B0F68|nr:hypothetical protein [Clostridium sp. HBUAS56017]
MVFPEVSVVVNWVLELLFALKYKPVEPVPIQENTPIIVSIIPSMNNMSTKAYFFI